MIKPTIFILNKHASPDEVEWLFLDRYKGTQQLYPCIGETHISSII